LRPLLISSRLPASLLALATALGAVSTAAPALFLRPGFIYGERSAIEFLAVERDNGPLAFAVIGHFHESKASGLSGIAVGYDADAIHRAVRFKQGSNSILSGTEAEISYKNIFHLIFLLEFAEQQMRAG
jgi:hypothetical protein